MTQKGGIKNIGLRGIKETTSIHYNPDFFGKEKDKIVEERDCYQKEGVDACSYEFISAGIHIWYGKVNSRKKIKSRFDVISPHIHMLFSIRADCLYSVGSSNDPSFIFSDQEHNILLLPNRPVSIELKPNKASETFSINLTPELFFSYFPATTALCNEFRESLEQRVPVQFSHQNLPITPRINALLYDILHCSLSGYSKRLYMEAKVIELLAVQLDQYEQLRLDPVYPGVKKEEAEKMHQVQRIIENNPDKTFSLKELSRQVGTNEYNLKKHFKVVFGNTVFGYLQTFRMEKAKAMLAEGNTKIAEVSRLLGYKHATHFTTAFKKYFGFLPNKMRAFLLLDLLEMDLTVWCESMQVC
ncbi:helix-turn-helix domain-containing protein [Larkinella insperata]|uniref:Helix-turn-helix domain-containing protein n=1 Tax=Larkinella insperata TaxID=332158 RepID=A0ABW3Q6J4_9BACT|nr:AraC family transcriptional regulator [Larkinella insperata]